MSEISLGEFFSSKPSPVTTLGDLGEGFVEEADDPYFDENATGEISLTEFSSLKTEANDGVDTVDEILEENARRIAELSAPQPDGENWGQGMRDASYQSDLDTQLDSGGLVSSLFGMDAGARMGSNLMGNPTMQNLYKGVSNAGLNATGLRTGLSAGATKALTGPGAARIMGGLGGGMPAGILADIAARQALSEGERRIANDYSGPQAETLRRAMKGYYDEEGNFHKPTLRGDQIFMHRLGRGIFGPWLDKGSAGGSLMSDLLGQPRPKTGFPTSPVPSGYVQPELPVDYGQDSRSTR